ncbi:MAG: hypothetical protein NUV63_04855 [Gallionella sp.]|nr:hypothetical protein [Gallionella sp.]
MFFRIVLMLLVSGQLLMVSTLADAAVVTTSSLSELSSERTALLAKMKELDASKSRIATLKAERSTADDSVRLAQTRNREARDNLEKKQKYDRENPGEITDKLREAEEQNKQAATALKLAKENLSRIESNLIAANATASAQYVEFKRLQQSFEGHLKALVETQVQSEVVKLQVAKVVVTKGVVSCGDDGIRVCKDKSKKEAEKNATEQGSIIDFSAFTEVKNFQLSKEEILSEVHATLSNEEVLSQKIVDESSAVTEIRVKVEPVISLNLRHRIADGIRDDLLARLGGRVDFSDVIDPSLDAVAATAQRRKDEQSRQDAQSVEAELEQQADEARRKSAQRKAESAQDAPGRWRFGFLGKVNTNTYSAAFTNAYNNKTASSQYLEEGLNLTVSRNDGYFVDISGAKGNGKHDLYSPAPDQALKRSSAAIVVGRNNKAGGYFLSYRTATTQMAAIGQTWTLDTLTSSGLGGGIDFLWPVAIGSFALSLEGGINSAKWSDDSGYSANSDTALASRMMGSYIFPLGKATGITASGVTIDITLQDCTYKFKTFTVNESINSVGFSWFLKF